MGLSIGTRLIWRRHTLTFSLLFPANIHFRGIYQVLECVCIYHVWGSCSAIYILLNVNCPKNNDLSHIFATNEIKVILAVGRSFETKKPAMIELRPSARQNTMTCSLRRSCKNSQQHPFQQSKSKLDPLNTLADSLANDARNLGTHLIYSQSQGKRYHSTKSTTWRHLWKQSMQKPLLQTYTHHQQKHRNR